MKVALFSPTVSGHGGMEAAIEHLIAGFKALGDDCRLYLLGGSFDKEWLRDIPHTIIGSREDHRLVRFAKYAVQPALKMMTWRPDAVIAADVTTIQMARLARALTGNWKMPIASWIHFPMKALRMKEHLGHADCHLAISGGIAAEIKALLPESSGKVFTIYNAIDVGKHPLLPRSDTPVFLYIGRLTYDDQKRVNDLLHALSRLSGDFKAKIIGQAPDYRRVDGERLLRLAADLGLDGRVEWLGWQSNPWQAAGQASALVMTSSHEGFPMVLLEAISRGVPCLSSDCETGPAEIIEQGKNGWLFPVADVDRLAERMQRIIDKPECLPSSEAVQATAYRFSAEAVAERARRALLQIMGA